MIEDDVYRTSTQFRLWSFSPQSLASVRANTNAVASERVRAAIRRAREARQATATPSNAGTPNPSDAEGRVGETTRPGAGEEREIECLTAAEELDLVRYFCEKTMELGDEYKPPLPTTVRATAIQYLRRFYLTNSPMTYHPKSIMPCALFLATKTDNSYLSLRQFAEKIPNSSTEDIIAPEFILTQGLRFTFDVRHPFRGLEGGIMELLAIANGEGQPGPHHPHQTPVGLQSAMESLPPHPAQPTDKVVSTTTRVGKAHHAAREILKSAAQMTDAYFLYTPSQIWMSALLLADRSLADFYLDVKMGPELASAGADEVGRALAMLRQKVQTRLTACAALLASHAPLASEADMKTLKRIGKKLYHCQNPEKIDLVGLSRAQKQKRDGAAPTPISSSSSVAGNGTESEVERAAKKRKLEREGRTLFGGDLVKERRRPQQIQDSLAGGAGGGGGKDEDVFG